MTKFSEGIYKRSQKACSASLFERGGED